MTAESTQRSPHTDFAVSVALWAVALGFSSAVAQFNQFSLCWEFCSVGQGGGCACSTGRWECWTWNKKDHHSPCDVHGAPFRMFIHLPSPLMLHPLMQRLKGRNFQLKSQIHMFPGSSNPACDQSSNPACDHFVTQTRALSATSSH